MLKRHGLADLAKSNAQLDASKNRQSMVELFGAYGWAEGLPLVKYLANHMMVRGINHLKKLAEKEIDHWDLENYAGKIIYT